MGAVRVRAEPWMPAHRQAMRRVEQELERVGQEIERDAVRYLRDNSVNVDGDLRKSITSEVRSFMGGALKLITGPTVRYGEYVHGGTRPHWPPQRPIRRWVRRKLGVSGAAQVRQVAFLVARKISREGTEGQPFLEDAFERAQRGLARRIQSAYLEGFPG